MTVGAATRLELACPACGMPLPEPARCRGCGREFELVAGLPDLRLEYPDPFMSREEDNARARELAAAADGLDFADLLRLHWRMSDRPATLVERFVASDLRAVARSDEYPALASADRRLELIVQTLPLLARDPLLGIGPGNTVAELRERKAREPGSVDLIQPPHDVPYLIALETGIPGGLVASALLVTAAHQILCLRRIGVGRGINGGGAIFFHFDYRSCVGGSLFSGLWPAQHPPREP